MKKVYYFDNSATSNPKPKEVIESVVYAIEELNANPGRGSHSLGIKSAKEIYKVREKVSNLFNLENPLGVGFTNNSTTALNYGINSLIKENSIVATTEIEHNSVLRSLYSHVKNKNIKIIYFNVNSIVRDLTLKIKELEKANKKIEFLVLNHMSNVTGETIDLVEVGKIARKNKIKLIVDASQSAGIIPIDMGKMNIDILAFTGHKSLYGIQGIGGICVKKGIEIKPIIVGGTGSYSRNLEHPKDMPDVIEAGTVNTPGIMSLGAGIDFINKIGILNIYNHEQQLKIQFLEGIRKINSNYGDIIKIMTSEKINNGPVVTININGLDSGELSYILDTEFGIITRSGLHCAPKIHEREGTEEVGGCRFSFGYFNTKEEIEYALQGILLIVKEALK